MAKLIQARGSRALRNRAMLAAIAVTAAPFLFLITMSRWEIHRADVTATVDRAALDALINLDPPAFAERARAWAAGHHLRVRRFTSQGALLLDLDHTLADDAAFHLGELLYGPLGPAIATLEGTWGPVLGRPELSTGESARFAPGGNLLVHAVARRTLQGDVVHVQGYSRRAVLPSFAETRQFIKLLSFASAFALIIGWLLSRQLLRPLERLRLEVLARAVVAVPKAGIDLGRKDEVGDLAESFNTLLTALAERTQTNEAFLSDLAHELKNPVAAVRTSAELMAQGGLTPERVERLTAVLLQSSTQLDLLVTQFLELARAEAGLPHEPREQFVLGAQLRELQRALAADPRFGTVTWRLEGLDANDVVDGVPTRLERAFSNLLRNALSFAGDGGWVRLSLKVAATHFEVQVQDSGPGIDPEQVPRLFERFFTTRHDQQGTGLGLAMTRAIVEAHGGRIHAASPAGGGALFTLTLPRGAGLGK